MEGASLWNPWIWNSKASWELGVAWEVCRVCVTGVWHGNKWYMTCSNSWHRPEVWTNSISCRLDEGSSFDWNDLQGDGHASTGEHVVRDCQSLEHRCIQGGVVNHWDFFLRSTLGLTDYWGIFQTLHCLRVETECQNKAFQHPWWVIHIDRDG